MRTAERVRDLAMVAAQPGPAASPPGPPEAVARTRISVAQARRLLVTPASEAGIHDWYRALLGRRPSAGELLGHMTALRTGRTTRIDVLFGVAYSPEGLERGLNGPGMRLIRLVALVFRRAGPSLLIRLRRRWAFVGEVAERADAMERPSDSGFAGRGGAGGDAWLEAQVAGMRDRLAALEEPYDRGEDAASLRDRVVALETALLALLDDRARAQQGAAPPADESP